MPNRFLSTLCRGAAALLLSVLAACSVVPAQNAALSGAQAQYQSARDNPEVIALAGTELQDGARALEQARSAWSAQAPTREVDHLAFLASKKIEIAQALSQLRQAERTINAAQSQRTETLLSARTQQAENAERAAEQARQLAAAAAVGEAEARQQAELAETRAAELKAQLAALDARQTARGMVVTLGHLLFDSNSDTPKPAAALRLQRLGAFLMDHPQRTALVEGHTDSVGSEQSNQSLSERRAEAVKQALVGYGVAPERLRAQGLGEAFPVASNHTELGRQRNRRVEVILSDESGTIAPR